MSTYSQLASDPLEVEAGMSTPAPSERRRKLRARMNIQVRICGGHGTRDLFEDIVTSVNVTRDGLLVATHRKNYSVGDLLEVTCPYWTNPTAINTPRKARVVRSAIMPDLRYGVALQFLPREQPEAHWVRAAHAPSPYPSQVRILAVESNDKAARALRTMLEHDGYNVVVVGNPCDALAILSTETPDALVIEAEGNEMCGADLCAIVKTNERLRHIPVVFLTSSAMPSDYAAGHRLGAILCMTKPCKPEHVRRAVHLVAPPPSERTVYSSRFNMGAFVRTA